MTIRKNSLLLLIIVVGTLVAAKPSRNVAASAEAVISAFSTQSAPTLPDLLTIAEFGHQLPVETQQELRTIGFNFTGDKVTMDRPDLPFHFDAGIFRLHYDTSGINAVSTIDTAGEPGIPDYIEMAAEIFQNVYSVECDSLGFTRPPGDNGSGGSNHYDLYYKNLPSNYYAITYPGNESGDNEFSAAAEVNAWQTYIVMRNNYDFGFPLGTEASLKVTAAHEFFHAVQFGYDSWESIWLLEATAVLMEEIVYDEINDCYQYLRSWFPYPERALDLNTSHAYGSYIFFSYIQEHMGGNATIKRIFEYSIEWNSDGADHSHKVIDLALQEVGASFQEALNNMAVANLILSPDAGIYSYAEANEFPVSGPALAENINFTAGDTIGLNNTRLSRFASQYYQVNTLTPVLVTMEAKDGNDDDLQMSMVSEAAGAYTVKTGKMLNFTAENQPVYLVVVSQDTNGSDWDFRLFFQDGDTSDYEIPADYTIHSIYPNPYVPAVDGRLNIEIISSRSQAMEVVIYNVLGQRIATIQDGFLNFGKNPLNWNGKSTAHTLAPAGVYFIMAVGDKKTTSDKFILIR